MLKLTAERRVKNTQFTQAEQKEKELIVEALRRRNEKKRKKRKSKIKN
jgi:hypothetical protein